MSKRRSINEGEEEAGVDISPLIDCVFILLIFFIVTTVFVEEKGIKVDKPQSNPNPPQDTESQNLVIGITAQGKIVNAATGVEIGDAGIQSEVRKTLNSGPDASVVVQASRQAPTSRLIFAVDQARAAGAEDVSVAADPSGS